MLDHQRWALSAEIMDEARGYSALKPAVWVLSHVGLPAIRRTK